MSGKRRQQRCLSILRHKDLSSDLKDLHWSEDDRSCWTLWLCLCIARINITNESREAEIRQIFVESLVLFGESSLSRLKDTEYCLREDYTCDRGFPL